MARIHSLAVAACVMLLLPSTAPAAIVSYSAEASLNGGPFAFNQSIMFGGSGNELTVQFIRTFHNVEPAPFTFASLGRFQASAINAGATIPAGTTVDLRISQTQPTVGTAILSGTMSGAIDPNTSTAFVEFNPAGVTIGEVIYTPLNPTVLNPNASNNGESVIQARIVIPEPALLALLPATALLVLRRRHCRP